MSATYVRPPRVYPTPPYLPKLVEEAAKAWSVPADLITSDLREMRVSRARQAVMWVLYQQGLALQHIAAVVGRKDHTTVIHAIRRVESDRSQLIMAMALELAAIPQKVNA